MPDSIDNSWQINKPLSAAVHTYTLHAEMHEVYVQVHLHKSIYAYLLKRLHFFTSDFHSTDTLKQRQACWVNKSSEKRESTSGLSREGRSSCCVCQRKRKSSDWQDKWKKLGAPHLKMVYIYFGNVKSILDSLHSERRERWWSSLSVLFSLNFFFFLFFFSRVNITLELRSSLKWNICKFKNTRRQNDCWKSNTAIFGGMVKMCLSACLHNVLKDRFFFSEINSPF